MSPKEMRRYMDAEREAIEQAYRESDPPSSLSLDVFAVLWLDAHAVTFREGYERRAA